MIRLDEETEQELLEESKKSHASESTSRNKTPKARVDGTENIPFKITYCDGGETEEKYGFRGVCSAECRIANQKTGRSWCNEDKYCLCAQLSNGIIDQAEFDQKIESSFSCYEARTLIDWKTYAGTDNAKTHQDQGDSTSCVLQALRC